MRIVRVNSVDAITIDGYYRRAFISDKFCYILYKSTNDLLVEIRHVVDESGFSKIKTNPIDFGFFSNFIKTFPYEDTNYRLFVYDYRSVFDSRVVRIGDRWFIRGFVEDCPTKSFNDNVLRHSLMYSMMHGFNEVMNTWLKWKDSRINSVSDAIEAYELLNKLERISCDISCDSSYGIDNIVSRINNIQGSISLIDDEIRDISEKKDIAMGVLKKYGVEVLSEDCSNESAITF